MRCDQYIGLNPWALKAVSSKEQVREVGTRTMSDGRELPFDRSFLTELVQVESVGVIEGAWDSVVADLHRYTLPDGTVYEEYVQASPWSSGPCYFIALKDPAGEPVPASLWTKEQLSNC